MRGLKLVLSILLFTAGCAPSPVNIIIGESEGEPYIGKLAVACALRNKSSLVGVYGHKSLRVTNRLYPRSAAVDSQLAWEESGIPGTCDFISGAQHWQSEDDIKNHPSWITYCEMTAHIGGNYFFKCN